MEVYEKEYLLNLGIYQLRTLARNVGVKAPTTKKHNELVDCILKIQSGDEQIIKTNKGRPPKQVSINDHSAIDVNNVEGVMAYFNYADDFSNGLLFSANNTYGCVKKYYNCAGIVRHFENKRYIYSNHRYTSISFDVYSNNKLKEGDYVVGKAYETGARTGLLETVEDVNFQNVKTIEVNTEPKFSRKDIVCLNEVYKEIDSNDDKIKIILELEVDNTYEFNGNCVQFSTEEFASVKKSFNAILDCVNAVKTLCKAQKTFSLYLIDIDYIFTILQAYLSTAEMLGKEYDSCQYLKMMFAYIKNSNGGNIVVYENSKYRRNEYLDAILNKYL